MVNGVYARRAEEPDGRGAYEKVGVENDPRFLYYCSENARWKIDDRMRSKGRGYAYLKVTAQTPVDAGPEHQWHVCDKRGRNYEKDPDIRCTELAGDAGGEAAPRGESTSDSADSEASDQSSSTSSGKTPAQEERPVEAALARAGKGESQRELPVSAARARACAKMLCRSGLRCACHFRLAQDCPNRKRP